jgi:RNA polymerase sigma factor (sigma-70 family)
MEAVALQRDIETAQPAPARWGAAWESREAFVELFRELSQGRRDALGALYDLAADRLYGLALWRTGTREDAAEVVQEVFVRVAERRSELDRVRDPRGWLLAVTHRLAVDATRRRRRRGGESLDGHLDLASPETDLDGAVDARRAWALLRRLTARQREVIWLHHAAGLSFAEIGRATGVPTFTAASRYRLGVAALRRLLGRSA